MSGKPASSKAGTGLGVPAAVACAACCALPVRIAAGAPSGAGAAVPAERMPLIAAVLAGAALAVFAFTAWRRRGGRRPGCGDDGCRGRQGQSTASCSCAGASA
ncbi:mercuric ion transport protein [Actinocorallia herbida]|uniref:Mercuric ion transport protein n=1 Tax=Actinocorallia herbida TaxID=58109 RepID=A0A3N1D248_9ACTN|nr:hypothetical protein [Actinocorallia herbida]ROO87560.1 mercuric ion transport protein [Actinocorallia herbida]